MAVRPNRKPATSLSSTASPQTLGAYTGMAQDGPARKTRPLALAEELVTRGCSFIEKGVWDEAEKEFRKALKMSADYPEAYNNLGLCMLFDGRPAEAREALMEAVRLLPGWHCAEANLGLAYQQLGKHEESVNYYRLSLTHKPQQPQVNISYGDELNALGRAEEALAAYQKALDQLPNYALAYSRLGLLHARRGKINEAESALSRAVQLDPSNADASAVLGAICARRGNFKQAKDWFSKASVEPVPAAALRGSQRIAQCEAVMRAALQEWKTAQSPAQPLAECYFDLGLALLAEHNENEAQGMFQRAAQQDPAWVAPQKYLALNAALQGDALIAKTALENAARAAPQDGSIPEQLGYIALAMGTAKEAEAQFKQAQALGRQLPPEIAGNAAQ